MKPGETRATALILDTLPECKVVYDAIHSGHGIELLPEHDINTDEGLEAWGNSLPMRFRRQARHIVVIESGGLAPGFVTDEIWGLEPRFSVTVEDVPFVCAAAERILNEKNTAERVFNRVTRRTSAAKRIFKILANN